MRQRVGIVLAWLALVVGVVLLALAVAAIWLSGRPQEFGLLIYGSYPFWVGLTAAVAFGLALLVRRFGRRLLGWFGAAAATPPLLLALVVGTPQVVSAFSEGVVPGPANSFGIGSSRGESPDQRDVYATLEDGTELSVASWLPDRDSVSRRPALIWLHGGGFTGGGVTDQADWLREVADEGYPVFAVDYRLAPPERASDASSDVACAIHWVRQQSDALNLDPDQIVLGGREAGGSLALNTAYGLVQDSDEGVVSSCGDRPDPPAGVMAAAAPVDLRQPDSADQFRYLDYLGGTPDDAADNYRSASPRERVGPDLPRTLVINGQVDPVNRAEVTEEFVDAVAADGNQVRHVVYPFGGNRFDAPHTLGEAVRNEVMLSWLQQWHRIEI